ncbi:AraC family transcriptional regulator [Croceitalea rosinachiae]|uniref:GyrI-like domain-containing protein n=1 Tax=Croceitalea rosinachiae TaxID=3075596 RepID=A0ABU3A621_9FLAO|nr:GyrI-like domain-containing protein [Croceitalea sp. F388]MDT0605620.1 GyrI-like domain-containing protein [Croceitalea sp. F388]
MEKLNVTYRRRIEQVIEYINNNLDQSLTLNQLAQVACFSPYHFHRIFVAVTDETVNNFTNRMRLEKGVRLLKFSKVSVLNIALETGFSSAATFSRSFKQYFGLTAMEFRKKGNLRNSKIGKDLHLVKPYLAAMNVSKDQQNFHIKLKTLPRRRVAFIRVMNSFRKRVVLQAYERMITWAKRIGIYDSETIFGMSLDDIMTTPKSKYRYDVCMPIPNTLVVQADFISTMYIPNCKYATTLVSGDINRVTAAFYYLYEGWLINSSYEPEHQQAIEIFRDKDNVCNWDHFELELCIPIKSF